MKPGLTILNSMAGNDFIAAMDRHVNWGLKYVDLKDRIFGKTVSDLDSGDAARVSEILSERGLRAYCFSTGLLGGAIESGESAFRAELERTLPKVLKAAERVKPRFIRLLAPATQNEAVLAAPVSYIAQECPWLITLFQEAVDTIHDAGFEATIENEIGGCVMTNASNALAFLDLVDRPVGFTWDIQNMWQMGEFPSLAVYEQLRARIGFVHLKGGRWTDSKTRSLQWRSSLADSNYPVKEILEAVVRDGLSPVVCINPPHGKPVPGEEGRSFVEEDIAWTRSVLDATES